MKRTLSLGAMIIALALPAGLVVGQEKPPTLKDVLQELQRLRERVDTLEKQHEIDQDRIRQLDQPRAAGEPKPAQQRQLVQGELAQPFSEPVGRAVPTPSTDLTLPIPPTTGLGQGNLFNPQITAFFDMGASLSTNGENKALNRFNLREAEVDFQAAISPFADGVLILAIGEEIGDTADGIAIDTVFELEEGYINFHTLPFDLTLKAGKFRNTFGRNNLLHTHDLPQITRPLAVQAFFGPEGLATVGASTSWLVPNPWDKYIDLTVDVVNADGGAESPILGGPNADNPAVLAHLKLFDDIGESSSIELGGSYLFARTSADSSSDASIFGLDATYQWRDPKTPDSRSLLLQSELFWAQNDINGAFGPVRNDSFGMYAFGQYQFEKNWYSGVRIDYTEFPNSEVFGPGDSQWAFSPYISYYLTEFLRLRFEYQHREFEMGGVRDSEDNFFFGLTFSIGSHPAHPYWVNR